MKPYKTLLVVFVTVRLASDATLHAQDLGTGFTYQGELVQSGTLVEGDCEFAFSLWDAPSAGSQISKTQTDTATVENGRFTLVVDFGTSSFAGQPRYLQAAVCCPAPCGSFTMLSPRQELTPTPNALFSDSTRGLEVNALGDVHVDGEFSVGNSINFNGTGVVDLITATTGTISFDNENLITTGDVTADQVLVGNGSASAPGFRFTSDINTGLFRPALDKIGFSADGSERMRLTATGLAVGNPPGDPTNRLSVAGSANFTGNVGVGTSTPLEELHLGQTAGNVAMRLGNFGGSDWDLVRSVGNNFPSGSFGIQSAASATPFLVVNPSGRVGIGTTSPVDPLDVVGNIHATGTIKSGASITVDGITNSITSTSGAISFDNENLTTTGDITAVGVLMGDGVVGTPGLRFSADTNTGIFRPGSNQIGFSAAGLERMRLTTTGLAIGNSPGNPTDRLNVFGTARIEDTINQGVNSSSPLRVVNESTASWGGHAIRGTNSADSALATTVGFIGAGVWGDANPPSLNVGIGVLGTSDGHLGVAGVTDTGSAVTGEIINAGGGGTGRAGWFLGRVDVTGTLTKGGGSFKIDHPLDPNNSYLSHSFVESPDMMNVYNGMVLTDEQGYGVVELPDYFETLNRDYRFQLTVVDDFDSESFVLAKVVQQVRDNRFKIRTSAPTVQVSWQVTGIRKDPWAEANRIQVVEPKPESEKGRFLHPQLYGAPANKRIGPSALSLSEAGTEGGER